MEIQIRHSVGATECSTVSAESYFGEELLGAQVSTLSSGFQQPALVTNDGSTFVSNDVSAQTLIMSEDDPSTQHISRPLSDMRLITRMQRRSDIMPLFV